MKNLLVFLWGLVLCTPPMSLAEQGETHAEKAQRLARSGNPDKGAESYILCRGCHRADAAGKPEAGYPQLVGQHPGVLIKQMLDVRDGQRDNPKMRPFIHAEVISEQDMADIAVYLQRLPRITTGGQGTGQHLAQGSTLYARDCAACHGEDGEGDSVRLIPRVAGQHFIYLFRQLRDSRDHLRRTAHPVMQQKLQTYDDDALRAVSDFMSRLPSVTP